MDRFMLSWKGKEMGKLWWIGKGRERKGNGQFMIGRKGKGMDRL